MLDPDEFEVFMHDLGEGAEILRVDAISVLESVQNDNDPAVRRLGDVLTVAEPFIADYLTQAAEARCGRLHCARCSTSSRPIMTRLTGSGPACLLD